MHTSTILRSAALLSVALWGSAVAATSTSGTPAAPSSAPAPAIEISCRTFGSEVSALMDAKVDSPNIARANAAFELGVADCMAGRDDHANMHYQQVLNLLDAGASPAALGMILEPLDNEPNRLEDRQAVRGVLVSQVDPDGWAWRSGIRSGDVIVRVGVDDVATPLQVEEAVRVARLESEEQVPVVVMRQGTIRYLGLVTD